MANIKINRIVRIAISMIGVFALVFLVSACNISDTKGEAVATKYNVEALLEHKSLYIGDASNISGLLGLLPLADQRNGIALETSNQPYGLEVAYKLTQVPENGPLEVLLMSNAAVLFSLIENLDEVTYSLDGAGGVENRLFTREQIQKSFQKDLKASSADAASFSEFLQELDVTKWVQSSHSDFTTTFGFDPKTIKTISVEGFAESGVKKVESSDAKAISDILDGLNKLKINKLPKAKALSDFKGGIYLYFSSEDGELNSGLSNYLYIDTLHGYVARHMPTMSRLPLAEWRFENPTELKAVIIEYQK